MKLYQVNGFQVCVLKNTHDWEQNCLTVIFHGPWCFKSLQSLCVNLLLQLMAQANSHCWVPGYAGFAEEVGFILKEANKSNDLR